MITCATRAKIRSFKLKIASPLWLLVGYSLDTRYNQTFPSTSTRIM